MEQSKRIEILTVLQKRYGKLNGLGFANVYANEKGELFYVLHSNDSDWFTPQKSVLERIRDKASYLVLANTHHSERLLRIFAIPMEIIESRIEALGMSPNWKNPPKYNINLRYSNDGIRIRELDLDIDEFKITEAKTDIITVPQKFIKREDKRFPDYSLEEDEGPPGLRPIICLHDHLQSQNLFFEEEVLKNYFISLKTKPLVILTGISGTGKTLLAKAFAEAVVGPEKERFAFVSVRPDWLDNKGLLGFHNLLNDTFQATEFLKVVLRASVDPERPYFAVLDEMNLAKVEYYFSDFLSAMESGTEVQLHNLNGHLRTSEEEKKITVPYGSDEARDVERYIPPSVKIPQNLFISGTVNIDETTHPFSPKVLDRANTIELSDVAIDWFFDARGDDVQYSFEFGEDLGRALFERKEIDWDRVRESFREDFKRLQGILIGKELHFGYRVIDEMMQYVGNAEGLLSEKDAFDIQITQKILPKIGGSEEKVGGVLLSLKDFCDEREYSRSSGKIQRMLERLEDEGFTSFF